MTAQIKAPAGTKIVLGSNQYGKAEVHLVKITRDTDRHQIQDLNVTSQLHGDFAAAHTDGDNAHVVATDTRKTPYTAWPVMEWLHQKSSWFDSANTSPANSIG